MLSGMSVLLKADTVQTDLLNRECFRRPRITVENNEQWFQLCMEEAFHLYHSLICIKIVNHNDCELNSDELWKYETSKGKIFLFHIKPILT
uniref:tRNA-splicing endonuclease subunit Sen2-2-like n=1 Tax=Nicotiana sylvestris TaxID=4096 RepID=A0A1U7YLW2_NICSY|nr:PREDICTED: tRNA-splicing endonuclease subunit Sen2-2-like [Nicotiana sylvestris]